MNKEMKEQKAREMQWQAEDDARIMAQYQEIIGNKARMNRATKEAKKQANEMQKRVNIMNKVSKKSRR